jgi:DNA ligase-1
MLAHIGTEKRIKKMGFPCYVQPKLNGNRCRVVLDGGFVRLFSSQGNLITSVTHINGTIEHAYQQDNRLRGVYDGELYVHGMARQNLRSIIARQRDLHPNHRAVELHLFDSISTEVQSVRLSIVADLVRAAGHPVVAVPTFTGNNWEDLGDHLTRFIRAGYEGIILRSPMGLYETKRSGNLLKIKPVKVMTATITGLAEEVSIHGEPKDSLGAFLVTFENGAKGRVGSGFSFEERTQFWYQGPTLEGRRICVKYHELSEAGVPCPAIFMNLLPME